MRRIWVISAGLSLLGLVASCGENQCHHVVERTCSDLRGKAQQFSGKLPSPEDLCSQIDWKGREKLQAVCTGEEVRRSISDLRPNTPLKVTEAMCDGLKLHILTPDVDELKECRTYEEEQEHASEQRKLQSECPKPEEPEASEPPPAPVSTPTSASSTPSSASSSSAPAGSTPAGTPAPAGTPPATPAPAGTPAPAAPKP